MGRRVVGRDVTFPLPLKAVRVLFPVQGGSLPDALTIRHACVVNHATGQLQVIVSKFTSGFLPGHQ